MRILLIPALTLAVYSSQGAETGDFSLNFSARFEQQPFAVASIEIAQTGGGVKRLDLKAPADKYELLDAAGEVEQSDGRIVWEPPSSGGSLRYRVSINQKRKTGNGGRAPDAVKTDRWAIVRLGDLFPPARIRASNGADGKSYVSLSGPKGWSFETRYGPVTGMPVPMPGKRLYNRPTGWLVAGDIGTRREDIDQRIVTVAAPKDMGFPRLDILTFLNWTLPEVTRVFPDFPKRLLIAGAPREMWRGGLSAPGSLYLHIDRPLVSENATSSLLHELVHVAGIHSAVGGGDWIVEGLAEYYSLLVLKRSGGISRMRFDKALHQQREWADRENGVLSHPSKGANTARAVLVLHELAGELQTRGVSIDKVARALLERGEISPASLQQVTEQLLGAPSTTLSKYLSD